MGDVDLAELLAVAVEAARAAGRHTMTYFGDPLAVTTKADGSPVTRADVESEGILRREIGRRYPHHAVLGEEGGETAGVADGRVRWVIDPLDGTKSFVAGVPLYGVLVGVEVDGRPVVGACYLPATDEMVAAAEGRGCTHNGRVARVSDVDQLEDAAILTTNGARCMARWDGFGPMVTRARLHAGWGDAFGHMMVATGRADVLLDPRTSAWDVAALVPILREAGGDITGWAGGDVVAAGDAVSSNGRLHRQIVAALADARPDGPHVR
jgi:histidinol phosphatase-like enzyme (inositol monophosphatase family)